MATPRRSEKQGSKHSYLATPWCKLNCHHLVMGANFIVWAMIDMENARSFETSHASPHRPPRYDVTLP